MNVSEQIDQVFGLVNVQKDRGKRMITYNNKSNEALELQKLQDRNKNNIQGNDPNHFPLFHHNPSITKHKKRMSLAQNMMFYDNFLVNLKDNEAKDINKNHTNSKYASKHEINKVNHNDTNKGNKVMQRDMIKKERSSNNIKSGWHDSKEGSVVMISKVKSWKERKDKSNNNHISYYSNNEHTSGYAHQSRFKEKQKQSNNEEDNDNIINIKKRNCFDKGKKRSSIFRVIHPHIVQKILSFQIIDKKEIKGTLWNKYGVQIKKFEVWQVQRMDSLEKVNIISPNKYYSCNSSDNGISTNNLNSVQQYKLPLKERSKSQLLCCL